MSGEDRRPAYGSLGEGVMCAIYNWYGVSGCEELIQHFDHPGNYVVAKALLGAALGIIDSEILPEEWMQGKGAGND